MEAINLTNASSTTKRREHDFYPTPPEVTHALMKFLNLPKDTAVWEPACGDGAMSEVIAEYCCNVDSTDLRDDDNVFGEGGIDFLKTDTNCTAIITNPPFCRSEEFIRHALGKADIVCMVLKSQYWHAKKRIKLFEEHPPAFVLPLSWRPDFLFRERLSGGKRAAPTMEVTWTVWIKGDTNTKYRILSKD